MISSIFWGYALSVLVFFFFWLFLDFIFRNIVNRRRLLTPGFCIKSKLKKKK